VLTFATDFALASSVKESFGGRCTPNLPTGRQADKSYNKPTEFLRLKLEPKQSELDLQ
jgi:hypothetical protein